MKFQMKNRSIFLVFLLCLMLIPSVSLQEGFGHSINFPEGPIQTPPPPPKIATLYTTQDGDEINDFTVVTLGSYQSTILLDGTETLVPSTSLTINSDAKEGEQMGYLYAPRTGKASFRSKPSNYGQLITSILAGTIFTINNVEDGWAEINFEGRNGYVLLNCVEFLTPVPKALGEGVLHLKGDSTGKAKINIRNTPSMNSSKVASLKIGTLVTLLSYKDSWYEMEYNGYHGFVKDTFIQIK